MKNDEILNRYIPLVHFLGKAFGPDTEIVLHNFKDPDASIIAISNGQLSKRKVGGPMTNLAAKVFLQGRQNNEDEILNYTATGPNGKKFKSSSYFIENDKGDKIGALCVNIDTEKYKKVYDALGIICGFTEADTGDVSETLNKNIEETLNSLIEDALMGKEKATKDMKAEEKIAVVKQLYNSGAFLYKKGIPEVAKVLKISEPTLYRYLSKVKKDV